LFLTFKRVERISSQPFFLLGEKALRFEGEDRRMNWKKFVATGFGTGYLPIGPGSWGTFPGMLLCWCMQPLHPSLYLLLILLLGGVGIWLATVVEANDFKEKDPGAIVIDEIVAFPLTMFLIPLSLGTLMVGFFFNRLMDTMKIWPCYGLQRLPGGWGIMIDDLIAAVYSCIIMHVILHYWPGLAQYYPVWTF
jgi:phosphatidylglycerophosphatase A